jgi:hypothetical protein
VAGENFRDTYNPLTPVTDQTDRDSPSRQRHPFRPKALANRTASLLLQWPKFRARDLGIEYDVVHLDRGFSQGKWREAESSPIRHVGDFSAG